MNRIPNSNTPRKPTTPYCPPESLFGTLDTIQKTKKHVILLLGEEITRASLLKQEQETIKTQPNLTRCKVSIPLPSSYVKITEHTGRRALIAEGFNYDETELEESISRAKKLFAEYTRYTDLGKLIAIAEDNGPTVTDGTRYKLIWTSND